jgi:hypothetical protein
MGGDRTFPIAAAMTLVEAWDAVHGALPAGWDVGPLTVMDPSRGIWSVSAHSRVQGRSKAPQTVTGTGVDGASALVDLGCRLRAYGLPPGRMDELRARLRLAYDEAADELARASGDALAGDESKSVSPAFAERAR